MVSAKLALIASAIALGQMVSACNTISQMKVPKLSVSEVETIDAPTSQQASFALKKVVANIKRGTAIAHFPAGGVIVVGMDDYLCNFSHGGSPTLEWGAGSSFLGDWSSELGEIFYETMEQSGVNVVGNPKQLFKISDSVAGAEYLVGARVFQIKGNFCHEHHWYTGHPLRQYRGEMFVSIEWSIFSNQLQRIIHTFKTSGYFLQKQPKKNGIAVTFQNAFANAVERMLGSKKFRDIALRRETLRAEQSSDPVISIPSVKLLDKPITDNQSTVLSSVVTIRTATGHGSGFLIAEDGLILTNEHVVGNAKKVSVILNNGLEVPGEVLRRHARRDVALIRVSLRAPFFLPVRTTAAKALEKVYVIGSPIKAGNRSTVSTGIISGKRLIRKLRFLQSDAAISPGNSGGPMLDTNGNLLGISVSSFADPRAQNLNLFIPIRDALKVLNIRLSGGPS
jgi:serine protease Do